jgi:hypothetical protein
MQNVSHISKVHAQIRVRERDGVPGRGFVLVPGERYDLSVEVAPGETLADVTRPEWFEAIEPAVEPAQEETE